MQHDYKQTLAAIHEEQREVNAHFKNLRRVNQKHRQARRKHRENSLSVNYFRGGTQQSPEDESDYSTAHDGDTPGLRAHSGAGGGNGGADGESLNPAPSALSQPASPIPQKSKKKKHASLAMQMQELSSEKTSLSKHSMKTPSLRPPNVPPLSALNIQCPTRASKPLPKPLGAKQQVFMTPETSRRSSTTTPRSHRATLRTVANKAASLNTTLTNFGAASLQKKDQGIEGTGETDARTLRETARSLVGGRSPTKVPKSPYAAAEKGGDLRAPTSSPKRSSFLQETGGGRRSAPPCAFFPQTLSDLQEESRKRAFAKTLVFEGVVEVQHAAHGSQKPRRVCGPLSAFDPILEGSRRVFRQATVQSRQVAMAEPLEIPLDANGRERIAEMRRGSIGRWKYSTEDDDEKPVPAVPSACTVDKRPVCERVDFEEKLQQAMGKRLSEDPEAIRLRQLLAMAAPALGPCDAKLRKLAERRSPGKGTGGFRVEKLKSSQVNT
eukprot:Cvel_22482.t1-p1 / transcript=Cvel_22482.t1 / gene=Cvel_22482 / organism=Chromera_velia_CCMP2878 / gene_product=hypothetical protein / transcript_product=hypothetical protein / location=Cvel_scaffold2214:335-5053(-) / protein_length=494 / sequence_SO=supercontig / SO=protein_coding / is_pseudo=false